MAKKSVTIQIDAKEPDQFQDVIAELELPRAKARKYFEFGECARLELTIDADMKITGRVLPV